MRRSYELLRRVTNPTGDPSRTDDEIRQMERARDILFHFCSDAFHLRDWIISSISDESVETAVRKLFRDKDNPTNASTALAASADIANGFKHRELDHPSYTPGGYATVLSHTQGIRLPAKLPASFSTNHWTISAAGDMFDVVELADQAVAAWDKWLKSYNLLPHTHP
jgi:hypothetical protein